MDTRELKRVEAMVRATGSDPFAQEYYTPEYLEADKLARMLDAYFAHTRFCTPNLGIVELTPEPIE